MPIKTVNAAGPGIAFPRLIVGNLMTPRRDVKKGHAINGLSLPRGALSPYDFCKEGLDKAIMLSIFFLA
ncbi:MAG: hypothetical protein A4E67_00824 [Syntrophaceae bacterium PtaB.Bin038]|jgi:hypothetical protein|nr:MAG: hypothetical protein A4E67_00824 [Syntrophaceae bacterium PtaB.Bin038]